MNIQKLILSAIRALPGSLVGKIAGPPLEIDGYRLDPHMHLASKSADLGTGDGDLEALRSGVATGLALTNGPPRRSVKWHDTEFAGPGGALTMRVYKPANADDKQPAVLFFHQGGLVVLDLDTCHTFCTQLAEICRAQVISLDYRLCPEHAFPAPIDDAMALWDHVQQNAGSLNVDPARVAVAGDSAGGLISANMCHLLKARGGVQPAAQLLVYPWVSTDVTETGSMASCAETFPLTRETMDFFNTCVFPDGKMMDHALANPTDNPDLSGLPPAIVATAGFDPIRDQGNAYAEKLKAAGNQVTHYCFGALTHSFLSFGGVTRVAEQACEQLARDLSTHLNTR